MALRCLGRAGQRPRLLAAPTPPVDRARGLRAPPHNRADVRYRPRLPNRHRHGAGLHDGRVDADRRCRHARERVPVWRHAADDKRCGRRAGRTEVGRSDRPETQPVQAFGVTRNVPRTEHPFPPSSARDAGRQTGGHDASAPSQARSRPRGRIAADGPFGRGARRQQSRRQHAAGWLTRG